MTTDAGRRQTPQDRCPIDYDCDGGPRCPWHTIPENVVRREYGLPLRASAAASSQTK